jgi:RNA polymerase sigma-70 factor (ECF subfamily)
VSSFQTTTDSQLVEQFKTTNQQALFDELLNRHDESIHRIAAATLGVHLRSEVEDLCQDIRLKLYDKLHQFTGKAKFTTWLYRVVKNAAIDYQRRSAKHLVLVAWEDSADIDWKADTENMDDLKSNAIDEYVQSLPLQYRTVVYMQYWQGLTTAEIGEYLGISQGTVKSYLHRAKNKIRLLLKENPFH